MPGTDPDFDARYTQWLKEKSAWVPLGVIREVPVEELAKAGFPAAKVEAFRAAFKAMEDEEMANPGQAGEQARDGPDRGLARPGPVDQRRALSRRPARWPARSTSTSSPRSSRPRSPTAWPCWP